MANGTDLELLARYASARDAEAFAELVARHRNMVYAACYRVLASRADAEDSTQECFLRLARNAETIERSVVGWLHRVAVRTSIDVRRSDRARRKTEREAASMAADGSTAPSWDAIKAEVDQAVDQLPDKLREALLLHFLEGKPQQAVAEELGLTQPAVSVRIRKGIEQLRGHLKETGLVVSAAGLTALLSTHAAEAAVPATLTAALGKIALAGVGSSPAHVGAGGSALGVGVMASAQAKIACVVAASLAVGAVVQQTIRRPGMAREASTTAQEVRALRPADSAPEAVLVAAPAPVAGEPDGPPSRPIPATPEPDATPPNVAPAPREPAAAPETPVQESEPSGPDPAMLVAQAPPGEPALPYIGVPDAAAAAPVGGGPAGALAAPAAPAGQIIERPGVRVFASADADPTYPEPIADVVSLAKQKLEELFPDLAKPVIHVRVLPAPSAWRGSLATDRRLAIYVRVGEQGMGEIVRADAGPIGMLCQAVAELYNPQRMAGLDRFLTHAYLAPAVTDALGPDVLPRKRPTTLAEDGFFMLETITSDLYGPVHPDFAAAGALVAIEGRLGLDELRALLASIPPEADDPFAVLRQAAVERDPAIAGAFAAYDQATTPEPEEDGTYLIASFEPDETIRRVFAHPLRTVFDKLVLEVGARFEMSQTDEWATHGTHSLRLHREDPRAGVHAGTTDPDWQFKDWRRFTRLDMDLMLVAAEPERVAVWALDDTRGGHGWVSMFSHILQPGKPIHLAYPLTRDTLRGVKNPNAAYFGGRLRADEMSHLYIAFPDGTQPATLYLDNLRLTPRGEPTGQVELFLSPTGVMTMTDDDGLLGTLWLTALGPGWRYTSQRAAAAATFARGGGPGPMAFSGELAVPAAGEGCVLFEQRFSPTDGGVEVQHDIAFRDEITLSGLQASLRFPCERFAGGTVAVHPAEGAAKSVALPEERRDREPWLLLTTDGARVELLTDTAAGPVLTVGVEEPGVLPITVQDMRRFGSYEYEVNFVLINADEGRTVSPDERHTLKLHLDLPGAVSVTTP